MNNRIALLAKELLDSERELEFWNNQQIESFNLYTQYKKESEKKYEKYNDARSMIRELNSKMASFKNEMRDIIATAYIGENNE